MRASYAVVQSATVELQSLLSLPSGYHRDLQLSKGPLLRAIKKTIDTMSFFPLLIKGTRFIEDVCEDKIDAPMHATDLAIELSAKGIPFRTAYQKVANSYDELEQRKPKDSLDARISPGGCGNLMLDEMKSRLDSIQSR